MTMTMVPEKSDAHCAFLRVDVKACRTIGIPLTMVLGEIMFPSSCIQITSHFCYFWNSYKIFFILPRLLSRLLYADCGRCTINMHQDY